MRRAHGIRAAFWAVTGLSVILCALLLFYTSSEQTQQGRSRHHRRRWPSQSQQWGVVSEANRDVAPQNPTEAPPTPFLAQALATSSSSEMSARSSFLAARDVHRKFSLGKRGPLRCDDAPCIDGSCCSKDNICGFGPDYCGAGCLSQCTSTAMCGEHSEDGEIPCGMKLCCSAMGWCGVSRNPFTFSLSTRA
jgi:chitinase